MTSDLTTTLILPPTRSVTSNVAISPDINALGVAVAKATDSLAATLDALNTRLASMYARTAVLDGGTAIPPTATTPGGSGADSGTVVTTAPDLVITSITTSPAAPKAGDKVTFVATFKNQGTANIPSGALIAMRFTIDGDSTTSTTSDPMYAYDFPPGASSTLRTSAGANGGNAWTAVAGSHTVYAIIDPDSRIGETSKTNNGFSMTFTVTAPDTGGGSTITSPRIMALGDSITNYDGSYRVALWDSLVNQDKLSIDFVGSQSTGPATLPDKDNEGHPGWWVEGPTTGGAGNLYDNVDVWQATYRPDIIVLHIGTNDLVAGQTGTATLAKLKQLVDRIFLNQPSVRLVLCTLIPGYIANSWSNAEWSTYNAGIPGIVSSETSAGRRVWLADMGTSGIAQAAGSDTSDGIHPTAAGYAKMSAVIYPKVKLALAATDSGSNSQLPGVPTGVGFVMTTANKGTLKWSPPLLAGTGDILRYSFGRGGAVDAYNVLNYTAATTTADTLQAVFGNLVAGSTYTFWVAAVNAAGTGPQATVTFTVTGATPVGGTYTDDFEPSY